MSTGRVLAGRFACHHLLKSGGALATYAGVDLEQGSKVIVKTVDASAMSAAVRLRLAHEAIILRRLETPDFRPLVTVGQDEELLYLVQPLVPGVTLCDRLGAGPLSVASVLRVGIDVVRALQHAHDAAVLHRDVKPANVIVDGCEPIERAVLIDFGFARSAWLGPTVRDEPVGTVRYLAPEAAGALGRAAVDQRSDLYAVGVLLFECLAGRPPFAGNDVGEVIRQHLSASPPSLCSSSPDVPRALDAVIQRLLRKQPDERYQSAGAALADLQAIAEDRARGIADPAVIIGTQDRRQTLTEPAFVGRRAELAVLADLVAGAGAGHGRLALVEAESGGGKSRLLEELVQHLGSRAWVLRGQGVDQAAQRPFQILEGIAAAVLAGAAGSPLGETLRGRLGDRAAAVVAALPALAPVLAPGGPADTGPEAYGEARSVEALDGLIDALGDGGHPAVVVLDDCQWADRMSLKLLARWGERAAATGSHVVVIGAFRSEEVGADHLLRSVAGAERLELTSFTAEDVGSLVESMAGPIPAEAVDVVVRLSEGSPFMAAAVLRGLVESGALVDGADGWHVDPSRMAHAQTSRRAALFLVQRLELLSADALSLLSVGAVLGKDFDLGLAVDLTDQAAAASAAALSEAARRRILWVDEKTGRCSFRHDKLRETLLTRLTDSQRRALHLRAALRIEAVRGQDRPFELAYHFDAGGRSDRALPYALEAAEQARARHALEVAVAHYRVAERATATDAATNARVAEGLGDVLTLQGEYEEAVTYLERARLLVKGPAHRAAIEGKLGDVAFKRGDQGQARGHLEGALRHLGRRVPRCTLGFLLLLVKELAVQAAHTAMPRILVGRRRREGAEEEFAAIRMYSRLAYVYWFHAGKIPCGWAHLRGMNLAERYPPTPELAQAYSEHAPVMTMVPWYRRGMAYAQRSLAIRRALGDIWGQGQSLHFYGVVLYAASRYQECIARCEEGVRLLERTGDRWEVNTATWHIAFAHYRLGELRRAVEVARGVHSAATDIGDQAAAGIALSGWARASQGRVPADLVASHLALAKDTGDAHTATEVHLAEAVRLLGEGSVDEAIAVLERAVRIVRRAGLRQEYVAPVVPWLATALRMRAEQAPPFRSRSGRRQLRRAARVARHARLISRDYRNNRPHALREQALIAALRGQSRRARRRFAASLAEAAHQDARYEYALTSQAWGRVGESLGWPNAAERRLQAEADVSALERSVDGDFGPTAEPEAQSLSLADRFESLLGAGRRIASAPSAEAIYQAVSDAAFTLLRGERCDVVPVEEGAGDSRVPAPPAATEGLSRTLMSRALEAGGPVVAGGEGGGTAADSVVLLGLRSVLCAPIFCEDRPVACLLVSHRQIGGLFSQDEVKLAEFIATLAGAALEHVAGTEARFRSLAQNSSDVITIIDANGLVSYQSSSVERVFGFGPSELTGRRFEDWVHPDDAEDALAVVQQALEGMGVRPLFEGRLRHGDGTWRHVETAINDLRADPSVCGLVLNSRDVSERHALEDELRARARHDDLTGLANRGLFAERLDHSLARRTSESVGVIFLDLDDFKGVNDTLGHPAGDLLLQGVAGRLLTCVRPHDTVARLGGDEFAILLEESSEASAVRVADRVLAAMTPAFDLDGQQVHARASLGVAVAPPTGVEAEELLTRADAAMYVAKLHGKCHYELFQPAMRAAAVDRATLAGDLQWAVECGEMQAHYQPLLSVKTGEVAGFEAVLRWNHPVRGMLMPADFIPVAEESGLIVPIGAWALRQACLEGRRLQQAHPERGSLGMSVNVSTRQLQHPGLWQDIVFAIDESGFDPRLLTLEITESATVHDTEGTIAKLAELKRLGLRLAIDDFGTGYSSLSYLRRFPVDQLKIDRSFVAGIGRDPQDTAIVTSVIGLAHALGLEAVAEGVETMEQLEHLTLLGCDLAQGFNWKRPAAVDDVDAWLTPPALAPATREGSTPRAAIRTLLVDDRPEVRAAIRLAMELDGGFEVVAEATDGQEAIAAAAHVQPDLVLLDLVMPGMGGLQALEGIRSAAPRAGVVMLTAMERSDVPPGDLDAILGLLDKTVDLDALVQQLSTLMQPVA